MKFLFATDTHATAKGPSSRTDSYAGAVKRKLTELAETAKAEGVQAVIHGGDLFDKPVVSLQLMGEIAQIIRRSGVPWYVVPGNHDLFGYDIKTLAQTSLGTLARTGVVDILDREHGPLEFTLPNGETGTFEGQEYHRDIDHQAPMLDYYVQSTADHRILVPHSMLLDKEYFPDVPYTKVEDLKNQTNAHLILVGHYHDGFEAQVTHASGAITRVVNPGSMLRDEASKGNLTRQVKYLVIDVDDTGIHVTPRPFLTAEAGTKVFDRSHITSKQAKNRYLDNFQQKLQDSSLTAVDVRTVLNDIVQKDATMNPVIATEAHTRLTDAEQTLDDVAKQMSGYVEKQANVHITKIRLQGFQSHEDSTIELTEGLNAIVGPSDSGKSAIIRALRFALFNEPKGADFIRNGAKECAVHVHFSDGSALVRRRTKASAGSYEITYPDGTSTTLKGFANNVPVDVPNTHQMPQLQIAKDMEASLNIGYQLDVPFLIGDSPSTRAAVIGQLTGVNLVDAAMREVGKDILASGRDVKTLTEQVAQLTKRLEDFDDVDVAEQQVLRAEMLLDIVEERKADKQKAEQLLAEKQAIVQESNAITQDAAQIREALRLSPVVTDVAEAYWQHKQLAAIRDEIQLINDEFNQATAEYLSIPDPATMNTLIYEAEQRSLYRSARADLLTEAKAIEREEADLQQKLNALPQVSLANIEQLQASWEKRDAYASLLDELNHIKKDIVQARVAIKTAISEEQDANALHQRILTEAGTCPVCGQITTSHKEHDTHEEI